MKRKTYLLTWNPKRYPWKSLKSNIASLDTHGRLRGNWSCRTGQVKVGDRIFLLRQGEEPRGIVASGIATSEIYEGKHWDKAQQERLTTYVHLEWDAIVDPKVDGTLSIIELTGKNLSSVHWGTQSSGIEIPPAAAADLELKWEAYLESVDLSNPLLPGEVQHNDSYPEGALRTVTVNAYERNPRARRACVAHHGPICAVCDFKFEQFYGPIGKGFIHVHHVLPLSKVRKEYKVDPIKDMVPVCPNCHAMLHGGNGVMSIQKLRKTIQNQATINTESA